MDQERCCLDNVFRNVSKYDYLIQMKIFVNAFKASTSIRDVPRIALLKKEITAHSNMLGISAQEMLWNQYKLAVQEHDRPKSVLLRKKPALQTTMNAVLENALQVDARVDSFIVP